MANTLNVLLGTFKVDIEPLKMNLSHPMHIFNIYYVEPVRLTDGNVIKRITLMYPSPLLT